MRSREVVTFQRVPRPCAHCGKEFLTKISCGVPRIFCPGPGEKCRHAYFDRLRFKGRKEGDADLAIAEVAPLRQCTGCDGFLPDAWPKERCIRCEVEVRIRRKLHNADSNRQNKRVRARRLAAHLALVSQPTKDLSIEE